MTNDPQNGEKVNADEDAPDGSNSSFDWEFVNDDVQDKPISSSQQVIAEIIPPTKVEPAAGTTKRSSAMRQVNSASAAKAVSSGTVSDSYVRSQLERAMDRWWAYGAVPPLALLRDGLLLLDAGGSATEGQRTLLLRAAIVHGRGIQTALRHQVDKERVAMVLAEALVEWEPPLEPKSLASVLGEDQQVCLLLAAELERNRVLLTGEGRRRAEAALAVLPPPQSAMKYAAPQSSPQVVNGTLSTRRRLPRQLLLLLLLATLVGFVLWQQRQVTPPGMVAMPAADYAMLGANEGDAITSARLDAFFIDRFEVTNEVYRACVDKGQCAWPQSTNSATRSDYFMNPAFNDYPVVNVTQDMASAFCAWQDKRLPTVEEWQAAASVSPTTGQAFRYPWGESFDPQRTNSAHMAIGDTVVVGSFRPGGDSASGAADMAGNVAEWTATKDASMQPGAFAIVKGGGFADDVAALAVGAYESMEMGGASPEIGFRCVHTHLLHEK